MIGSCIAMALALSLDGISMYLLVQARASTVAPGAFLGMHSVACAIATLSIPGLLPPVYRKLPQAGLLFMLAITLSIPVLGMLGIALALLPALWRQQPSLRPLDCLRSAITIGLERIRSCSPAVSVTGHARITGILQSSLERSCRLQALVSTLSLDAQQAAPLLRLGLKDRDDEVRLLAYSLLTRKEKVLEDRIGKSLRRLDKELPAETFSVHRSLARDYWELAGLGNATSAGSFLLDRACAHAQAGVALDPTDASLQLLLGRILLKRNELEAARTALLHAVGGGIAMDIVAPFLAEITFRSR